VNKSLYSHENRREEIGENFDWKSENGGVLGVKICK
jgi:hypothetical protein